MSEIQQSWGKTIPTCPGEGVWKIRIVKKEGGRIMG
jgi:hypothetical protein